jgi:hypothetical protein
MNKKLCTTAAFLLAFLFGLSSFTVLADDSMGSVTSSEEVIYASLEPGGELRNAYAVVILNVDDAGSLPIPAISRPSKT